MENNNERIDDEPLDWGYIKEFISKIPASTQRAKKSTDGAYNIVPQQILDQNYNTLIHDLLMKIDCKVFDKSIGYKTTSGLIAKYLREFSNTDRLQHHNVFLTSKLYMDVMLSPKTKIFKSPSILSIDPEKLRFNYLSVSGKKTQNLVEMPIVTTIQFFLLNNDDQALTNSLFNKRYKRIFDKIALDLTACTTMKEHLDKMCNETRDFSLHKFYYPDGIANTNSACLIYRYDHCFKPHKNGTLPKLYQNIFPNEVREPHFHFNSGFGSIYKLKSKNEPKNIGVGYAIGITALHDYLTKLFDQNFKDKNEKELYLENDFGMPFLYLLHHDPIRLNNAISILEDLIQVLASKPSAEEVKLVNEFSNIITNTSGADLSPDDKISNGNILEK